MVGDLERKYRVAVVGNAELALGFKLAGVRDAFSAENVEDAEDAIRKLLDADDIGIIVITSTVSKGLKDKKIKHAVESSLLPMFVEVPEYREEFRPDTLRKLVMRAIGIDIEKIGA